MKKIVALLMLCVSFRKSRKKDRKEIKNNSQKI